nr:hypothetical protein [Evansella caseinilytica]
MTVQEKLAVARSKGSEQLDCRKNSSKPEWQPCANQAIVIWSPQPRLIKRQTAVKSTVLYTLAVSGMGNNSECRQADERRSFAAGFLVKMSIYFPGKILMQASVTGEFSWEKSRLLSELMGNYKDV